MEHWIRVCGRWACGVLLAMALVWPGFVKAQPPGESLPARPNLILIMADDLGFECLGANGGSSYQTPCLDQMAAEGMRFTDCYSQPICTPSRVKLMTGIYNVRNYEKFGYLPVNQITFANVLRDAGYQTCIAGKWQLGTDPELPRRFGFDDHCLWHFQRRAERYPNPGLEVNGTSIDFGDGAYGPDIVSNHACKFIEDHRDKPFLLYYPMILTHCPFCPTPDSAEWDPTDRGSKTYKGDPEYFSDMVKYMDKNVGKLLDKLDSLGIRNNTLVMFIGDNGTDQPIVSMRDGMQVAGGKGKMTDAGTHVPMIASWPGKIPAGGLNRDLITFTDFFATMCDVARVAVPDGAAIDSQSFWPQLQGQVGSPRPWIYCFYSRNGGMRGQEFVRDQRFKLYRDGRMYDLKQDPLEATPIEARTPEQQAIAVKLQQAMAQFKGARPEGVGAVGEKSSKQKK